MFNLKMATKAEFTAMSKLLTILNTTEEVLKYLSVLSARECHILFKSCGQATKQWRGVLGEICQVIAGEGVPGHIKVKTISQKLDVSIHLQNLTHHFSLTMDLPQLHAA